LSISAFVGGVVAASLLIAADIGLPVIGLRISSLATVIVAMLIGIAIGFFLFRFLDRPDPGLKAFEVLPPKE